MTEDQQTERAIELLARRLKERGDADAEVIAREFMTTLRANGWRPTEARAAVSWARPAVVKSEPNDDWRQARAELESRSHPAGDVA